MEVGNAGAVAAGTTRTCRARGRHAGAGTGSPRGSSVAAVQTSPLDTARVADVVTGAGRVVVVPRTGSTSSDLVAAAVAEPEAWPDRSVLVADHQEAGRGRSGRTWHTPPGSALTVSVLLRPRVPVGRWGWLPLLAGLAVVQGVADVAGVRAAVKWPNDVLVEAPDGAEVAGWGTRRKVAGVLAELVPAGGPAPVHPGGVVVGVGVNVHQRELPVPHATSLALLGADVDRTELLGAVLRRWWFLDERWRAVDGDARAAGLGAEVAAACTTLGSAVAVDLPGGEELRGTATGLSADGALEVLDGTGRRRTVLAGDVRHVRSPGVD